MSELHSLPGMTLNTYFKDVTERSAGMERVLAEYGEMKIHDFMLRMKALDADLNNTFAFLEEAVREPLNHMGMLLTFYESVPDD
jgi:hypothetical protein